jgi:hypothetical protein
MEARMAKEQSEVAALWEAVHSRTEALQPELLKRFSQVRVAGLPVLEYQNFAKLVKEVLDKTS